VRDEEETVTDNSQMERSCALNRISEDLLEGGGSKGCRFAPRMIKRRMLEGLDLLQDLAVGG